MCVPFFIGLNKNINVGIGLTWLYISQRIWMVYRIHEQLQPEKMKVMDYSVLGLGSQKSSNFTSYFGSGSVSQEFLQSQAVYL